MEFIQVEILTLSTYPTSGNGYALVLGEVESNRRLPIVIGSFEAQAIAFELEKIHPPRPLTHDLFRNALEAFGVEVTDVIVDDLREGTFFAKVRYVHGGIEGQLDARPSDAIALAVRLDVPILVAPAVMDEAGVVAEHEGEMPLVEEQEEEEEEEVESAPARPLSRAEKIEQQLEAAIRNEDYEKAARLRDELKRLRGEEN